MAAKWPPEAMFVWVILVSIMVVVIAWSVGDTSAVMVVHVLVIYCRCCHFFAVTVDCVAVPLYIA